MGRACGGAAAELDQAMAEMDDDGGGEVEFTEFRDWWVVQMDTSNGQKSKFAAAVRVACRWNRTLECDPKPNNM